MDGEEEGRGGSVERAVGRHETCLYGYSMDTVCMRPVYTALCIMHETSMDSLESVFEAGRMERGSLRMEE